MTSPPVTEDSQFGWMKITVSTVIASTVGVVILISFIVIMVFRIKMKRLRELRIARAFERIYQHGEFFSVELQFSKIVTDKIILKNVL